MKGTLITLIGPTAIGKTNISLVLSEKLKTEIISCDARKFYKELKIGTAPPDEEARRRIPHHFIGHLSIHQYYTARDFERDALTKLEKLFARYSVVIMVGGSGFYEKALTQGLDRFPETYPKIRKDLITLFKKEGLIPLQKELKKKDPVYYQMVDKNNHQRILRALEIIRTSCLPFSSFLFHQKKKNRFFRTIKIGLNSPREFLYERINQRVNDMMQKGLLEEARLYFPNKDLNALKTVGYRELFSYFEGRLSLERAIEEIKKNTRHYAKRQLTWYRNDPEVTWFEPDHINEIFAYIKNIRPEKRV
ncbi:tRNA (adenosine(37)-N6)-dimethylallyltransferase MiaA [Candidatus Walczuchella monophlebidarum]|uniref:tRNA (adenosine(37)-N6)-dimethylallyltransferase MiaA n=1 Tax=Candidatus Walczuchella monophlebidarum TaxID=1415657 RepID=UPI00056F7165|nr:tRNA (adenosine(37)-N6)-dimethylallyltransferase MiaA [Candidatus Walczuchella monophlebidarum]